MALLFGWGLSSWKLYILVGMLNNRNTFANSVLQIKQGSRLLGKAITWLHVPFAVCKGLSHSWINSTLKKTRPTNTCIQTPQVILAGGHLTTSCAFLRPVVIFIAYSQQLHCLAFRFLTSCISNNVLAGKLQKKAFLPLVVTCAFLRKKNCLHHLILTCIIFGLYCNDAVTINNYSLKSRGIVAKYLPSHEVAR